MANVALQLLKAIKTAYNITFKFKHKRKTSLKAFKIPSYKPGQFGVQMRPQGHGRLTRPARRRKLPLTSNGHQSGNEE